MNAPVSAETVAKPCPKCRGTAMEARGLKAFGKQTMLTGYYWHCFNDGYTAQGVDCEFNGPEHATSDEALSAWNSLPRQAP